MDSLISLLNQKVATPGDTYEISGDTFNLIKRLFTALWRGENIGNSATVKVAQNGPAGILLNGSKGAASTPGSYPWHLYNTTTGSTGQVQVNGGDDQVAQLNGNVCEIGYDGGPKSDTKTGTPPAYPQLSVTGNGFIIAYCQPTTAGTASPLAQLYLYFLAGTTFPTQDTANPAAFYYMNVATISNYATDGSGNVSFTVNNVYGSGYGPSTLIYCAGVIGVY